jgi:uncharacterized protein (DUF1501 family)
MNRRDFIKASSLSTAALAVNGMPIQALADHEGAGKRLRGFSDRIFVFVVLSGGNDGLNTVIPLDRYAELNAARNNVLIPAAQVLNLSGTFTTGLHPAMTKLRDMYNAGRVNIVQGVCYPGPDYSHFRATDIYNTASDSNVVIDSGWVGRLLNKVFPGSPISYPTADFLDPLAIQIGSSLSPMLGSPNGQIGFAVSNINNFYQIVNGSFSPVPNTPAGHELSYIRYISLQTQSYIQTVKSAATAGNNLAVYPTNNRLADQLKIVAKLISGGLKTPFYIVEQGGFDTHSDQVDAINHGIGDHANILGKVSDAISAFYTDLTLLGKHQKVAGCTITEFGRRIKSNTSVGTDHGAASPLITFGTNVIPGIIGTSPVLPANADSNDQVPMQYDFRQVYASILRQWFGMGQTDTKDILNGQDYTTLPIFNTATDYEQISNKSHELGNVLVYPNPLVDHCTIQFTSPGGHAQIQLFNDAGQPVRILYENIVQAGQTSINIERGNLVTGNYYFQINNGSKNVTGRLVVR